MKCSVLLLGVLLTANSAVSRYTENSEDSVSLPELVQEESVSRFQRLIDADSAKSLELTDEELTDFLNNYEVRARRDHVLKLQHGDKNIRSLWKDTADAPSISTPFRSASVGESAHPSHYIRAKRSTALSLGDATRSLPEAPEADHQGEAQGSSSLEGRPSKAETTRHGKTTISASAEKGQRKHSRRQRRRRGRRARNMQLRSLDDQHNAAAYHRGQRGGYRGHGRHPQSRSRTIDPSAEALALLTQKMANMEVELARLKETVLLQGAVHIRTAERLENMMLAQGQLALRNEATSRKVLSKVKECCGSGCSSDARSVPARRSSLDQEDDGSQDEDKDEKKEEAGDSREEEDSSEEEVSSEEKDSSEEDDSSEEENSSEEDDSSEEKDSSEEDDSSEEEDSKEEEDSSEEKDSSEEEDSNEEEDLSEGRDSSKEEGSIEVEDSGEEMESSEERDSSKERDKRKKKKGSNEEKSSRDESDSTGEKNSSEDKDSSKERDLDIEITESSDTEDRDSKHSHSDPDSNRRKHREKDMSKKKDKSSQQKDKKKYKHLDDRTTHAQTTSSTSTLQTPNTWGISSASTTFPKQTTKSSEAVSTTISTKDTMNTVQQLKPSNIMLTTSSSVRLELPGFGNEIRLQNDENRPSNKSLSQQSTKELDQKGKNKDNNLDLVSVETTVTTEPHVQLNSRSPIVVSSAEDAKEDSGTGVQRVSGNSAKESFTPSPTLSSSEQGTRGMLPSVTNNNTQRKHSKQNGAQPHFNDNEPMTGKPTGIFEEEWNTNKNSSKATTGVNSTVSLPSDREWVLSVSTSTQSAKTPVKDGVEGSTTTMSMTTERLTTLITATTTQAPRNLTVDLTTGHIENNNLPGVEWVVAPTQPSRRHSHRRWTRSATAGQQDTRPCAVQGVLKFTFSPPPAAERSAEKRGDGKPRDNSRDRTHRPQPSGSREDREGYSWIADNDVGGVGVGGVGGRKLLLEMEFQRPRRWVFNLGDSIANNGFSGDGSVQENDCEAQGYGSSFAVYASDKHPNGRQKLLRMFNTFIHHKVTLTLSDETLSWNNHHGNTGTIQDPSLFALSGQSDKQGEVNFDVFLGLNRVIGGNYRHGHGLCRLEARWLE